MSRHARVLGLVHAIFTLFAAPAVWAYDLAAHAAISARAVEQSAVDVVLRTLGFPSGLQARFSRDGVTRRAEQWVQDGAELEDDPEARVRNHFHNPLASDWDKAGLRWGVIPLGDSSALWQQNRSQEQKAGAGEGSWSWPNARDRYFEALTRPTPQEREEALAKLFRSLGQVMHLVQDASLPAHTRNDAHLYKDVLGVDLGNPDGYERWVDKLDPDNLNGLLNRAAIRPSDDIFRRPTGLLGNSRADHPNAPNPVKRLIDTGQYVGTNPDILVGGQIGLTEFSNGNFFSNDTIFADKPALFGTIPFPAKTSVELGPPEPAPGAGGHQRRYFIKVRHGLTEIADSPDVRRNYRLAVPSALYEYLSDALKDERAGLDSKVFADYAALLLPRAVGYSAALVDHFFRGELKIRLVGATQDPYGLRPIIRLKNAMRDERAAGRLYLYYETVAGERQRLDGWEPEVSVEADGEIELPSIPAPSTDKPAAELGRYLLVFKGQLGEEPEAVVATWFTVWVGYFGTVSQSRSCSRLPSNQTACTTTRGSTGPTVVIPDEDGGVPFGAEAIATESQSFSITPPVYSTDLPGYFYFGDSSFSQTAFYLFREDGGPSMTVTAGAPGCTMRWGTLAGGAASLAMGSPPEFETRLGFEGPFETGESTLTVVPGSLLFMFFPPSAPPDPLSGPGTSSKSTSCSIAGIRFPVE